MNEPIENIVESSSNDKENPSNTEELIVESDFGLDASTSDVQGTLNVDVGDQPSVSHGTCQYKYF